MRLLKPQGLSYKHFHFAEQGQNENAGPGQISPDQLVVHIVVKRNPFAGTGAFDVLAEIEL